MRKTKPPSGEQGGHVNVHLDDAIENLPSGRGNGQRSLFASSGRAVYAHGRKSGRCTTRGRGWRNGQVTPPALRLATSGPRGSTPRPARGAFRSFHRSDTNPKQHLGQASSHLLTKGRAMG